MSSAEQMAGAREHLRHDESPTSTEGRVATTGALSRRKVRRLEIGIFVRKIVNGRIVSEWQLPRRRRHVEQVSAGGSSTLQQGGGAAPLEDGPQPLALHAEDHTTEEGSTSSDSRDDGSTTETTTYEAGFFVRQESTVPPEYKDPPDG